MNAIIKFLLILLLVVLIIGVLFKINEKHFSNDAKPRSQPSYAGVVPQGFSTGDVRRVLDPRDMGDLLVPRLPIVRIADAIIAEACPTRNMECRIRAITTWVKEEIEHKEVVQQREYIVSPEETVLLREGDDQSISVLLTALLRAEGLSAKVGVTPYSSFVETELSGEPLRIDIGCANCVLNHIRYSGPEDTILWVE